MPPHVPKYVPPRQAAESRARRRAALYWIALALPVIFMLLAFGYSDQAPAALRTAVITLDQALGYPLARLLGVPVALDELTSLDPRPGAPPGVPT